MSTAYCYHKEFFMAGMLVALFLFEGFMLFGDIIEEENLNQMIIWIKKAAKKRHYQSRKMLKSSPIRKNSSREEKIKLIKSY